jgi:hypothetical protein
MIPDPDNRGLGGPTRSPDDAAAARPETPPPAAEKTLFQLSAELKNLIRGDRIFRATGKR